MRLDIVFSNRSKRIVLQVMKNSYIKFQWENDAFTLNITLMTLTFIFKIKNTETVKMKILSVVLFTSRAMRALKRS